MLNDDTPVNQSEIVLSRGGIEKDIETDRDEGNLIPTEHRQFNAVKPEYNQGVASDISNLVSDKDAAS
jgi:hypothetical protein